MLNSCALMLALAAGLIASAWGKDGIRVLVTAEILSFLFAFAFMAAHYTAYSVLDLKCGLSSRLPFALSSGRTLWEEVWLRWKHWPIMSMFWSLINLSTGQGQSHLLMSGWMDSSWMDIWTRQPAPFQRAFFEWTGLLVIFSFANLVLAMLLAAWRIRRAWREEPDSPQKAWLLRVFCTPRFWRSVFRRTMARKLQRNPVGWLQQYSWSARLSRWWWCMAFALAECLVASDPGIDFLWKSQPYLGQLLLVILAFTAAGSFRREK
ncbi:MAG: hypothetical protein M1608_13705 [Candidatus Omnitrophica bacterium]|nr:hypothetical protein [Candidatus Omnitrophota bacterium]